MLAFKRFVSGLLIFTLLASVLPVQMVSAIGGETSVELTHLVRNVTRNQPQHTETPVEATVGEELSFYLMVENRGGVAFTNATGYSRFYDDKGQEMAYTGSGFTLTQQDIKVNTTNGQVYGYINPTAPMVLPEIAAQNYLYFQEYAITITPEINTSFIRHVFSIEGGNAIAREKEVTIRIDNQPHVRSLSFTQSSIVGNGTDSTTLQATIFDPNGCADITTVRANLSEQLPGRTQDADLMTFVRCEADGSAVYELPNIQFNGLARELIVTVQATDAAGNTSLAENTQPKATLTIVEDQSPRITVHALATNITGTSEPILVDGTNATEAQILWHADKPMHYYVRKSQNLSGQELRCEGSGDLGMRTNFGFIANAGMDNRSLNEDPRAVVPAFTQIQTLLPAHEFDQIGTWYVRLCAATEELGQTYQGGAIIRVEKVPNTGMIFFDLYDMALTDVPGDTLDITWRTTMQEGTYRFFVNDTDLSQQGLPATTINATGVYPGIPVSTRLDASHFQGGVNTVRVEFTDTLGNTITRGLTVQLVSAPNAVTNVLLLDDLDFNNGLDIRDVRVQWDAYANTNNDFHSYAVYLLDAHVPFQDGLHQPIGYVNDRVNGSGTNQVFAFTPGQKTYRNTDSQGNILTPGVEYRAYVQVQNKALQRSIATPSQNTKTYTLDGRPEFVKAVYQSVGSDTASGSVLVTFTMQLDPSRPVDPTLITGTFQNPANFVIEGNTLSFTVDGIATPNTSPSGNISIAENTVFTANNAGNVPYANVIIRDGIAPVITITRPSTDELVNELIQIQYTFSEIVEKDSLVATITQVGRPTDTRAPHTVLVDDFTTANTLHTIYLPVSDVARNGDAITTDALVSGGIYTITITARDTFGNEGFATSEQFIVDLGNGLLPATPQAVHGNDYTSISTPTLTWLPASTSNTANTITKYTVELFRQGEPTPFAFIYDVDATSVVVPLNSQLPAPGVYEFRIIAFDQIGNSIPSQRRTFTYVDEGVVISSVALHNTTEATLNGLTIPGKPNVHVAFDRNHTLRLAAEITEPTAGVHTENMRVQIRSLQNNSTIHEGEITAYNSMSAEFTTVIEDTTFPEGDYGIRFHFTDNAGIITQSDELFFTVDYNRPQVTTDIQLQVVPNPANGERVFRGGNFMTVTWNTAGIEDNNLADTPLSLSLQKSGVEVASLAPQLINSGTSTWEVSPVLNDSNMTLVFTVRDVLGRTTSYEYTPTDLPIIIDNTAPTQYPTIFTPNTENILVSAAQPYTITWGGLYADDLTPRPDHFVLAYTLNGGTTWTDITTVHTISGSYVWTVPSQVSSHNAYIRITAMDRAGNTVSDMSNYPFSIDSTQPEILTATTQDTDTNGYLDGIELVYNKPIASASVQTTDYSVAGYVITGVQVQGTIVRLTLQEQVVPDTDQTPLITYTQGTTADTNGELAVNQQLGSRDMASAVLINTTILDTNQNGFVDRIVMTFSEILAPNTDLSPWTFAQIPGGGTVTAMEVIGNTIQFTITEDTTNTPNTDPSLLAITFAGGTLADLAAIPVAPFQVQGNQITDTIAPVFTVFAIEDPGSSALSPVQGSLHIQFTEPVQASQGSAAITTTADWNFPGFTVIDVQYITDGQGFITEAVLTLGETMTETTAFPSLTFTGNTVVDAVQNSMSTQTTAVVDRIGPKVTNISIQDTNANGAIDELRVVFSEEITDINLSDIYINGSSAFTTYTIDRNTLHLTLATEITGTNPADAILSWNEGAFTDLLANPVRALAGDEYTGEDGVGPTLLQARFAASPRHIILTFSEPLDGYNLGSYGVSDIFSIEQGGSINGAHLSFDPAQPTQIILELSPSNENPTVQQSILRIHTPARIVDMEGNQATPNQAVLVMGSLIINEINWGEAGEEWIEIKNLDTIPVQFTSATPYSVYRNDQRIALLSSGTVPAQGFLIISKEAVTNNTLSDSFFTSGNNYLEAPDLDLRISANMTYSLHEGEGNNSANRLDLVRTDTQYPAGSDGSTNGIIASMERRSPVQDGTLPTSWQTATVIDGQFDIPTPTRRGTPGEENTIATSGPVIEDGSTSVGETRTPAPNTLTPSPLPVIQASYTDGGDGSTIDVARITVTLDGVDVTAHAAITPTSVQYTPSIELQPGQHTVIVTIYDIFGNTAQSTWSFWVDDYRVAIQNPPVLFLLDAPGAATSLPPQRTTVAVTTYGAATTLNGTLTRLLENGAHMIPEGALQYEVTRISQDAVLPAPAAEDVSFSNTFTPMLLTDQALQGGTIPAQQPGTLQTHYLVIQYHIAISGIQPADVYNTQLTFTAQPTF